MAEEGLDAMGVRGSGEAESGGVGDRAHSAPGDRAHPRPGDRARGESAVRD